MKRWGYQADARSTTHPISGHVPDTDATFYNFDGITYGKGASVIKQLVAEIGQDAFRAGLRTYFRRHAWGNATLADFLAALEDGAGRSLRDWSRRWLETASLNTIEASWTVRDGRVERLQLTQEASEDHPTLRPHALELALVRVAGDGPAEVDVVPARLEGAEAWVEAAAGHPAPDLVFPNHGDHGYARVLLDPASLAAVAACPAAGRRPAPPPAPLGRRSGRWSAAPGTPRWSSWSWSARGSRRSATTRSSSAGLDAARGALARYVPEDRRVDEARRFVAAALAALAAAPGGRPADALAAGRDRRRRGARRRRRAWPGSSTATRACRPSRSTARCAGPWPRSPLPTTCPGPRTGWPPSARPTRPTAGRGRRSGPRPAPRTRRSKAAAWERIHGEGYGSFHLTQAAMLGFNHAHQAELLAPYVERFFEALPGVAAERDHPFLRAYVTALFPAYRPDAALVERARDLAERGATSCRACGASCSRRPTTWSGRSSAAPSPRSGRAPARLTAGPIRARIGP